MPISSNRHERDAIRKPLQAFVDSLLQSTGQLMVIVDHMQRYPSDSAERSIDEALRTLLADVLEIKLERRRPAEFAAAASLIDSAREAIGGEILLAEPGPAPNRAARRRRRGGH